MASIEYALNILDRAHSGPPCSLKEWGLKVYQAASRDKIREAEFVVLPSTIQRQPWEGFGEVGFRCVREVKIKVK